MPTQKQGSITISLELFSKLRDTWEKNMPRLVAKHHVTTYSAYAQKRLEEAILEDTLEGRFEITEKHEDRLTVRDYFKNKDAVIQIKRGMVFCELDETGNCEHVGFVLADPLIIQRAQELGVRLRKSSAASRTTGSSSPPL